MWRGGSLSLRGLWSWRIKSHVNRMSQLARIYACWFTSCCLEAKAGKNGLEKHTSWKTFCGVGLARTDPFPDAKQHVHLWLKFLITQTGRSQRSEFSSTRL